MRYISNKFFCINCGKETIPLARKKSKLHTKFHRKKLYCPWCKETLNCIEIRSDEEKDEFIELFENGAFKEEAQKSIEFYKKEGGLI